MQERIPERRWIGAVLERLAQRGRVRRRPLAVPFLRHEDLGQRSYPMNAAFKAHDYNGTRIEREFEAHCDEIVQKG